MPDDKWPTNYPIRHLRGLTTASGFRFEEKYGPGKNWLDYDPEYHLRRAMRNLARSDGARDSHELADAINHIVFAYQIAERDAVGYDDA